MNELSAVAQFFKEGGIFMYFMVAVATVVIAIATERFIVIGRAGGLDTRKLLADLLACVARGDLTGARNRSRLSNAPAAQVAHAMLQVAGADETRLMSAADDAATLALPALTRRLAYLNVLANVATLLGLLGTISGLITAFSAVGAADPAQRASFMAAGISTALNATAFGLVIAIPTLLIHGWLNGMMEGIAEQVDEVSIRLGHALLKMAGPPSSQVVAIHPQKAAIPAANLSVGRSTATQGGAQ